MAKIWTVGDRYMFFCEGCQCCHWFTTPPWTFNDDFEVPTISPSILVRYPNDSVCHFFLKKGNLEYLQDSTHRLAGRTIQLCDI